MSHVVNDDFVRSDFVYDQVLTNRKSSEFGIGVVAPRYGCSAISAACSIERRVGPLPYDCPWQCMRKSRFAPLLDLTGKAQLSSGPPAAKSVCDREIFNLLFVMMVHWQIHPAPATADLGDTSPAKPKLQGSVGWCPWPESNQHSLRNSILSRARLPVPPQGPSDTGGWAIVAKRAEYSGRRFGVNPRGCDCGLPRQASCEGIGRCCLFEHGLCSGERP
jgi:hypothetical protein